MRRFESDAHPALKEVAFARRDNLPLEVEVLRLEELLQPPFRPETTAPTRTRFHTLLLVDGGESSHHVDFERYCVHAGDLLVIPKGRVQAFDCARAIRGYLVLFTSGFLEHCSLKIGGLAHASQVLLRAGRHLHVRLGLGALEQVGSDFATLARHTGSIFSARVVDEAVASAFALLVFSVARLPETLSAVDSDDPHDKLVARFEDLLEARFREEHEAFSYARALGLSLRTLDRHLLAARGQSARQCVSARLVLEAKRLLTKRDVPIKHIAYELGFSEPQNFTRFLRTRTGMSPRQFRVSLGP